MSREPSPSGPAGGPPPDRIFAGPGALRELCRELDWAATPLGAVEGWSASLRSAVQLVLASGLPNILLWGPEFTQIYNDAYAALIGAKHPYALGRGNADVWPEVWHINSPIYERVFRGETVTSLDALYPLERHGVTENVFLTISYSPVLDDSGAVGGVLANMIETTQEVAARVFSGERERLLRAVELERARLEAVFHNAPSFLAVMRGPDHVFAFVNEAYCLLVGRRDLVGRPLFDAVPEARGQGFEALMARVLETGEPALFREREVRLDRSGTGAPESRYIDLAYFPLVDPDGSRAGIIAHGTDITEQVRARQEVQRLLAAERAGRERTVRMQEVAARLSGARTPLQVAEITLDAGLHELSLRRGGLYVLERAEGEPPVLAGICVRGYGPAIVDAWNRVPLDAGTLAGDAVIRGEPVIVGRRDQLRERYPVMAPLIDDVGYCGGAAFPLVIAPEDTGGPGRRVLGFISFDFEEERELDGEDRAFLETLAHLSAQALDRTRLFEAEQRARESAERERRHLAGLVDALPVMVTIYEPALAHRPASIRFNAAFVRTLGWTPEDAGREDIMALCYPDRAVRAAAARHMQAPGTHWLEIPTRARDGRTVPVLWSNIRLSEEMQVGVGVDLTERKGAEAALEAERALLKLTLDQMPVGVAIAEAPSGRVLYTNPAGERLAGHPQHEAATAADYRKYGAMHEDGSAYRAEEFPLTRALAGELVEQHLMRYRRGDGEVTHLSVSAAPVYGPDGGIVRAVATWSDVGERVRLEEAMRTAMAEAERANRVKSEFLAAMSHELRTPLNAIAGYIDLLEVGVHGSLTEQQSASVGRIRVNAQHLTALISDILQFAKFEAGALELRVGEVPVRDALQELEGMTLPQIIRKGLRAEFTAPDPALLCRADPDRLRQILLNLVGNAIKFTDADGEVRVSCRAHEHSVHIDVADTGHGIPAEHLESIFDPFVQLERSRVETSQQGVGLGLGISRDLARSMNGDVTARSVHGNGSVFTLTLPRA